MAGHKKTIAERGKRVLFWLGFSVLFSLGPLFVNFLLVREKHHGFNRSYIPELYEQGELLVIAGALCADGMGRLLNHKSGPTFLNIFCLICVVVLLFISSTEYGFVASQVRAVGHIDSFVSGDCLILYLCAVAAGFGAVCAED